MFQVGVILHQAKSGRLIIRLSGEVKPGALLLDEKKRRLGKVVELIGPSRSPYASLAVLNDRPGREGDPAFLEG